MPSLKCGVPSSVYNCRLLMPGTSGAGRRRPDRCLPSARPWRPPGTTRRWLRRDRRWPAHGCAGGYEPIPGSPSGGMLAGGAMRCCFMSFPCGAFPRCGPRARPAADHHWMPAPTARRLATAVGRTAELVDPAPAFGDTGDAQRHARFAVQLPAAIEAMLRPASLGCGSAAVAIAPDTGQSTVVGLAQVALEATHTLVGVGLGPVQGAPCPTSS